MDIDAIVIQVIVKNVLTMCAKPVSVVTKKMIFKHEKFILDLNAATKAKLYSENKLVFLMGVEKARFRNPVIPDCKLLLKVEAVRSHGRVWKYKGEAFVGDKKMADAMWSATIVDKK